MILLNIGVLALVAGLTWWLTGIDKTMGGESKRDRRLSRAVRCVAVLFLVAVFLGFAEQSSPGLAGIPVLLIVPVSIALVLRSSLSELFTHGLLRFLDPELRDARAADLKKSGRYLDTIAHLIRNGRRDEAIKLCEEFKRTGEVDLVTLETMLDYLGVKQERVRAQTPLELAGRLRAEGKTAAAEQSLKLLLAKNPADAGAAMMLIRLYAQDLHQPGKAMETLRTLEQQKHVSKDYLEFARGAITEWSRPGPEPDVATIMPDSLDEMLAKGFFGTAIEALEQRLKDQPDDFDLRLKLAEVHAVRCHHFSRAEKIIRQIETGPNFNPEQKALAGAKLKEWRETRWHRK